MPRLLILAGLWLAPGVVADASAQSTPRADTLREAEAVARAVSTSAPARATAARVDAARAREAARSSWWADAPELEAGTALPTDGLFSADEYRVEAGVSARLEAPAVRRARRAAAAAERRVFDAEARAGLSERAFDVLERYAAAAAAEDLSRLARTLATDADSLVRAVDLQFRVGDVSELDLRLARLDAVATAADAARAEAEARSTRAALAVLVGIDADALGPLVPLDRLAPWAVVDSTAETPAVRAARAATEAAEAEATYATRRARRPDVQVRGGLELSRAVYGRDDLVADPVLWSGFERLGGSEVELTAGVAIPLVRFGPAAREAQAARADAEARRADAAALDATTRAEQAAARERLRDAEALRRLYASARPDVDESLALLRMAYAGGEMSLPDVLAARSRLYDSVRAALEAAASARRAAVDAARASGVLPVGIAPVSPLDP